jgi:hypothetical protein
MKLKTEIEHIEQLFSEGSVLVIQMQEKMQS